MSRERTRRDLSLALEAFYEGGIHSFWDVFDDTPLAAIAAFKASPEIFGPPDAKVVGINRNRLASRVVLLARQLAEIGGTP